MQWLEVKPVNKDAGTNGTSYLKVPSTAPIKNNKIVLDENSRIVLERRYLRRGTDGNPAESVEEMFERIASCVAAPDAPYRDVKVTEIEFYNLLSTKKFFPNSPTFTGAGTPLGQLSACFVLPIEDDLGKGEDGIFSTLRAAALIQQVGGGNGFAFSRLRPKGALVKTSNGKATGPVGFLKVYDAAFAEIAQGGARRGANMAVLRVDHPDIRDFIKCKSTESHVANFNISVGITDEFMRAVEKDTDFALRDPHDGVVVETVRAREIFDLIVSYAHRNGEPGVLFLDTANRTNPVSHLYELEATNPCVTGDTLVATPRGWLRAENIKEGDSVCTVLGVGSIKKIETHDSVPVFNVRLSDGGVVKITAAHQFHVRSSREKFFAPKRLDSIKVGEWIRVFPSTIPNNKLPQTSADLTAKEYGFLVGVLVGDGCYTKNNLAKNVVRVSSHADETEWNNLLENAFMKVGVEKIYSYVNSGSRSMMMDPLPGKVIANWVRELPLEPAIGPEKTLPDVYINSNREFLSGLLDGLFSTDGSVDLQSNHPLLRFHTSSRELALQVRRILLMFGIHGRICESIRKRHEINGRFIRNDRPKCDVVISGTSFGKFYEQVHLSHPEKQSRMEKAALMTNFTGGNFAAKVLKIELAGNEKVYDLYEPSSDTWITEGYVSRGCGEQWLGPYENCCLGSVNLAMHITEKGTLDWESLRESTVLATRFLDNVVSANKYVASVPQLRDAAMQVRRIGLGFMGLADSMYEIGIRYGSIEGCEFAGQVTEFIRYHCMLTSIDLARERGPFLAIKGSIYDPRALKWEPPTPLFAQTRNWGRPVIDWSSVVAGIKEYGIRNGAQTTVAPTGTISTVAGCEGYGCEPVFALAYFRNVYQAAGNDNKLTLTYTSPLFEKVLKKAGIEGERYNKIVSEVAITGTCSGVFDIPSGIRDVCVVSSDITPDEHVMMQASIQAFIDNSLSKTCNFPENATEEDVAKVYLKAWNLGCKGITVYVTGSRQEVVLETHETKAKKDTTEVIQSNVINVGLSKTRPERLDGATYKIKTPQGSAYINITKDGDKPFEVFVTVGKAGSDVSGLSEAMGRLISGWLRASNDPLATVKEIIEQLVGIGGSSSVGFGPNRVSSVADALSKVFAKEFGMTIKQNGSTTVGPRKTESNVFVRSDMCPECGNATLVLEEGCAKCYTCGYSRC